MLTDKQKQGLLSYVRHATDAELDDLLRRVLTIENECRLKLSSKPLVPGFVNRDCVFYCNAILQEMERRSAGAVESAEDAA